MKRYLAITLLVVVTAAAYAPGLSGPLLFDDFYNLKPFAEWLQGLRDWKWVLLSNNSGILGRPVSMGSLMLDFLVFGNSVKALKAVNLAIHLLNGVLVWRLFDGFSRITQRAHVPAAGSEWIPIAAAAIWMLHPLLVSTVLYVIQRMALLSTFFTLLTLLAYVHARVALERGSARKGIALMSAAAIATCLATLSKENGALAPSLCAVIELCLFVPRAGERRRWASRMVIGIGLLVPAVAAAVLVATNFPLVVGGYENRPFSLVERVLTQPRVLWDYAGSFALPNGPRLGLFHDDYLISLGLTTPPSTLVAIVAWAAAVIGAWSLRTRAPGIALGLGIYLVGHALESSIFPLLMYFEHRNYLPAVGLAWATVSFLSFLAASVRPHLDQPRLLFSFASVALIAALAVATWARAGVWSSHQAILEQGLEQHPESKWAKMDAIRFVLTKKPPDYSAARGHIDALIGSSDPDARRAGAAWGLMWSCLQDLPAREVDVAAAFGGRAITIEADLLSVYEAWGTLVRIKGCPDFSNRKAADALVRLADNAKVPQGSKNVRRIRYKAAELYMGADAPLQARTQADLAYTGRLEDAPVAGLIVVLDITAGDFEKAAKLIDSLDQQVPGYDRPTRQMIKVLKDYLEGARRDSQVDPRPRSQVEDFPMTGDSSSSRA